MSLAMLALEMSSIDYRSVILLEPRDESVVRKAPSFGFEFDY